MALLQISEPGRSPQPHQRRLAVGIDLGTTHSLVAAVKSGVPQCLSDAQGRVLLPSAVRYLPRGGRQLGFDALEQQLYDPENTILSAKRFMGRSLTDLRQPEKLPYRFAADGGAMLKLETVAGPKSPVQVAADLLSGLRQRAEETLGGALAGVVVTVPAYFDDAQRQATKDAAALAGLPLLRLLNEPTAAALAYGLEHGSEGLYAVFDLGGGTFDISLLQLSHGVFEVLATGGDSALGGDDYDTALADWVQQRCQVHPASAADKAALRLAARQCKEALTTIQSVAFCACLESAEIQFDIHREDFDAATSHLTERALAAVRRALRQAGWAQSDVQGVVLVGGATRMPQVRQAVERFFGQAPLTDLNPDEVVALGAAISAQQLVGQGDGQDVLLLDVTPLSLGIETMGGLVERIVPRNQSIPIAMAQEFTTYQDGQTALALHVVQGERDLVADCRSLARFELRGIPPMAAGAARIRVSFTIDADGLLSVTAQELGSAVQAQILVKPSYGLADEEIARMLQDSFASAEQDMAARALVQARVDAERLLQATRSALAADGDLLRAGEGAAIDQAMALLLQRLQENDASAIASSSQALAAATEGFAAQRMNRGIRQALAGKPLQEL